MLLLLLLLLLFFACPLPATPLPFKFLLFRELASGAAARVDGGGDPRQFLYRGILDRCQGAAGDDESPPPATCRSPVVAAADEAEEHPSALSSSQNTGDSRAPGPTPAGMCICA